MQLKNRYNIMNLFALTCAILAFSVLQAYAQESFFKGVGDVYGTHYNSAAYGVSADGGVVVGQGTGIYRDSPTPVAFRWDLSDGTMKNLHSGPYYDPTYGGSPPAGIARGVSNDHSFVVGSGQQAVRWAFPPGQNYPIGGGDEGLGYLPTGWYYPWSAAYGVSADGSLVVGVSISGTDNQAFKWTPSDGMVGIGALQGDISSSALGVSADGSVIVGNSVGISTVNSPVPYTKAEAFRWDPTLGMVGLGSLPGEAFGRLLSSSAQGVSADGNVVFGWSDSLSGREAFRWTRGEGMVGIGDFTGGNFDSNAMDASAGGGIMVGYGTTATGQAAFIWDAANGMRDLKTVLQGQGLDLTGWTLISANGISDDGLTIVGSGIDPNGYNEGWIAHAAVIPEPSTISLIFIGCIMLCGYFYRQRKTIA